jgi:hypothetical protein
MTVSDLVEIRANEVYLAIHHMLSTKCTNRKCDIVAILESTIERLKNDCIKMGINGVAEQHAVLAMMFDVLDKTLYSIDPSPLNSKRREEWEFFRCVGKPVYIIMREETDDFDGESIMIIIDPFDVRFKFDQ